jgi:Fe-S-cluster containining protein
MTACELCRGACCESLLEPVPIDPVLSEFRRARGKQITPKLIEMETVCPSLRDGRCDRYKHRPAICEAYKVGGELCVATVKRRRPQQAAAILALLGS